MSDFTDDCRRIEEWAKEEGALWLKFAMDHPDQKLGVDFTLEDLPHVPIDLPSRRKGLDHPEDQKSQTCSSNSLMPSA
jgi:hypothetical protein